MGSVRGCKTKSPHIKQKYEEVKGREGLLDSRTMEKKNKHMILDERIEIQECLDKGMTFKAICERIGKDQTTVSKEVKKHFEIYTNSFCN